MDIGIPLSQLASQQPVSTGCESLDSLIEGGLKPGCIYEIYGPPGSCKELLLENILNSSSRNSSRNLLIQSHKPISYCNSRLVNIYTTRITKFSLLLRFLQRLHDNNDNQGYSLLLIDSFAHLLIDHIHFSRRSDPTTYSDYATKNLNLLLSLLTRYANKHHAIILLVNHCMVSQRELISPHTNNNNNFLIANPTKKPVLTSALEWGNALGAKDAIGSRLLTFRLGLFWNWDRTLRNRYPSITVIQQSAIATTPSDATTTIKTIPFEIDDINNNNNDTPTESLRPKSPPTSVQDSQ